MRVGASIFFLTLIFSNSSHSANQVAVVKLIRGEVKALQGGKEFSLKLDDWLEEGAVVKSQEKSFVKLLFTDKSQMNIGPLSEVKIEKFSQTETGVIDLVKGKVRSQVTKDYLQIKDDKSKLLIKTNNAVMGVRGTDFMVTTNGVNTATILFEGEVVFNYFTSSDLSGKESLDSIADRGVRIMPGEFSVVEAGTSSPTVPAVLNPTQRESLESNPEFDSGRSPNASEKGESTRSVVPDGLSGEEVSHDSKELKKIISEVVSVETKKSSSEGSAGGVSGDKIRPANGSFVHLDSGIVIPPASDSVFDPNTKSFVAGKNNGSVDSGGNYVPPENVQITPEGKVFVSVPISGGESRRVEIAKPSPLFQPSSLSLTEVTKTLIQNPHLIQSGVVMNFNTPTRDQAQTQNSSLRPPLPPPSGGIDLNTAVMQRDSGRLFINVIK